MTGTTNNANPDQRPTVIQLSAAPVFICGGSDDLHCSRCGHTLVSGYDPRALIGIDIECFKCQAVTRTHEWATPEQPLPHGLINLGSFGRLGVTTVDLTRNDSAVSCEPEIARVLQLNAVPPRAAAPWRLSTQSLDQIEAELTVLTGGQIADALARAERARAHGNAAIVTQSPIAWAILELRDALAKRHFDERGSHGVALGYVNTMRHLVSRWQHHPLFGLIARTLAGSEFHHTVAMLVTASYLSDHGNAIGVTNTPAQPGKSPDLFIAFGPKTDFSIEVKAPAAFHWPAEVLRGDDIAAIVENQIKGARDQLKGTEGGVVVIGASHLDPDFATHLEQALHAVASQGRISSRVAAVVGVCAHAVPTRRAMHLEGRWLTSNVTITFSVTPVLNPRFRGINPLHTS